MLLTLLIGGTAWAQQRRAPQQEHRHGSEASDGAVARWTSQLVNELDHLYEDLYYDRVDERLVRSADQALEAAIHFQEIVRRGADREHLVRDFRDMDSQLHDLLQRLPAQSRLERAAARVRYADEQLHYYLAGRQTDDGEGLRRLLTRHAHALEQESRRLEQIITRYPIRSDRQNSLTELIREFAEEAEHFHGVVEDNADRSHLEKDFEKLDDLWHRCVDQLNRSSVGVWARREAVRVNSVHNQLHTLIHPERGSGRPRADRPAVPRQPSPPRGDIRRDRPSIEFEIPGLGRFQLGR